MSTLKQHNQDGYDIVLEHFGRVPTSTEVKIINEINERLDQFAHWPDHEFLREHRKFLHHAEGVAYFGRAYGEIGVLVASQHIHTDCGHVPKAKDYYDGTVDEYGWRVEK